MGVDVTSAFHKAVEVERLASGSAKKKKDILKKKAAADGFTVASKTIAGNIGRMREFLEEHRDDYLDKYRHLPSRRSHMTDAERKTIDTEVELFMEQCCRSIESLKKELDMRRSVGKKQAYQQSSEQQQQHTDGDDDGEWLADSDNTQLAEHRNMVLAFLYNQFQAVGTSFDALREQRRRAGHRDRTWQYAGLARTSTGTGLAAQLSFISPSSNASPGGQDGDDEAVLVQENEMLANELETMGEHTRMTEQRVSEIARLGSMFASEVFNQAQEIEHLYDISVSTTENVKEGNRYLEKGIEHASSFRFFILSFLIIASLCLLFLHWYT